MIIKKLLKLRQLFLVQVQKVLPSVTPRSEVMESVECNTIKEGKAEVLFPKNVFYNPVQEFNRDLTIAVISEFSRETHSNKLSREATKNSQQVQKQVNEIKSECFDTLKPGVKHENGLKILEGLSASGLRSVRFGLEIPGVKSVLVNDFDDNAVSFIDKNIEKNNLKDILTSSCDDAAMVMYRNRNALDRFDVIDLDPYGSPSQFLDATVQSVSDGGLLCITCTDAAVLCGNAGETCYSKYGAMSLRTKFCHEMGIRIILQCIESHANRYSRYIEPLISLSIDFYFRVFVRVRSGQGKVKRSASKMAMVYSCRGCGSFSLQKIGEMTPTKGDNFKYSPAFGPPVTDTCEHCGGKHQIGGPVWADPICNINFIDNVIDSVSKEKDKLGTSDRIIGMLTLQKEELHDVPFYFQADNMFAFVHCIPMQLIQFRSALLNAGYRVSFSHAEKNSIKTDAPHSICWDVIREWIKGHPVNEKRLKDDVHAKTLLEKECITQISFEEHPDANPKSRKDKLLRFQVNPEPHWGPKARATRKAATEAQDERKKKAQAKKNNQMTSKEDGSTKYDSDSDSEVSKKRKLNDSSNEAITDKSKPDEDNSKTTAILRSKKQPSWVSAESNGEIDNRPCKHFINRGQCRYGDKCKFLHTYPV